MISCPWCGRQYEPSGDGRCPHCGTIPPPGEKRAEPSPSRTSEPEGGPAPASLLDFLLGPEGRGLPWERRREFGFWRGLALTIKAVLFSPVMAFRAVRRDGGWGGALGYALITGAAGLAVSGLLGAWARRPFSPLVYALWGPKGGQSLSVGMLLLVGVGGAPLLALLLPLGAGLGAQGCLRLFGYKGASFAATLRVTCYAAGSAAMLCAVPFCGTVIFFAWYAVLATTGVVMVGRVRLPAALGAVLLPPLAAVIALGFLLSALGNGPAGAS